MSLSFIICLFNNSPKKKPQTKTLTHATGVAGKLMLSPPVRCFTAT